MKEIFLAISNKIQADIPDIRWIDFDLGQLDDEKPPVSFPCVLVRFDNATFIDLSQGVQQANLTVSLRVAFRTYERTHNKATEAFRTLGLRHLTIIEDIHTAINGLSGETFDDLSRTGYNNEQRSDLRVFNMTYTSLFTDDPESPYVVPDPENQPGFCLHINEPDD